MQIDSDYIATLVENKLDVKPVEIYELLASLKPLENRSPVQLSDTESLDTIFETERPDLFIQKIRTTDPQTLNKQRMCRRKIIQTIPAIHLLSKLGTLIKEDRALRNDAAAHHQYFDTIQSLITEKLLDISVLDDIKAPEFIATMKHIEVWLKKPIFTAESPDFDLDIKRHNTLELIRNLALHALERQCEFPLNDRCQWDDRETEIVTDLTGVVTEKMTWEIRNTLRLDTKDVLKIIHGDTFARTALEKSTLKQLMIKGYLAEIHHQHRVGGIQKYIDVLIHVTTIEHTLSIFKAFEDNLVKEDVKEILAITDRFAKNGETQLRDLVSRITIMLWIASVRIAPTIVTSSLIALGLLYNHVYSSEIDTEDNFDWGVSAGIFGICCHLGLLYNHFHFGKTLIKFSDMKWAHEFIKDEKNNEEKFNKKMKSEEAAHKKFELKSKEAALARLNRPNEENARIEKLKKEEENLDTARKEAFEQELKRDREIIEKREREAKDEEAKRKQMLIEEHARTTEPKGKSKTWPVKKPAEPAIVLEFNQAHIPPIAVVPAPAYIPIPPPRPPVAIAKAPVPRIVMFAFDENLQEQRTRFINHVKAIMQITQAPIKQQKDNPTLEDLAAMKYDVLQLCEHFIAIHAKEGCSQKRFVETLIRDQDIDLIYQLRNGLVHNDSVLTDHEKFVLYRDTLKLLSIIGTLHRQGDIQSNALCAQAMDRKNDFPVKIIYSETTQPLADRLTAPQQKMIVNDALLRTINQRQVYFNIICDRYFSASSKEETALLSKVLLITIAELGEIYKEIFVHQKLGDAFIAMYPNNTVDDSMITRFISARRNIMHIKDPRDEDVGVILSSKGSIFKQNVGLKIGII